MHSFLRRSIYGGEKGEARGEAVMEELNLAKRPWTLLE